MIFIFYRFHYTGLEFNTKTCSSSLKDITFIIYIITWDGIKHVQNKVQVIMDLGQPKIIN